MKIRSEYATKSDVLSDFCLWEYAPAAPVEGKLRSASVLFNSFDVAGIDDRIYGFVDAIRSGFGALNTVWGVKKLGNEIGWEFYFYDYRRSERQRSVARFLELIRPFARCKVPVNENLSYFMFSVDVDEGILSGSGDLEEIHVYIGNAGSTVSSGISYSFKERGTSLENFYFFFDAKKELSQIVGKAACSAHFDEAAVSIDEILWPELRDCGVIVVANKRNNDGVYFSRINVDQFIFFLKRMGYPPGICRFVEDRRSELDHLLYDVGFDYRLEDGSLVILKSGYYGVF